MNNRLLMGLCLSALTLGGTAAFAGTLDEVMARGNLRCSAHNGSQLGFAQVSDDGHWTGFDIDMCRVMATAVFGTYEDHLELVPISWAQRWPLLQSGELDIVIKQSGWTQSRDTELGLNMTRPYIIGTFQVLAHADLGAEHIADLDGGTICAPAGSTNEKVMAGYAATQGLSIEIVSFERMEELMTAFYENRCDGFVSTATALAVARMNAANPADYVLLPDAMALEAQSWFVREGDDDWFDIANWALNALWFAEQEGITSENVDQFRNAPTSPQVARFLGVDPGVGQRLGLSDDWAYNVIRLMGNYGEIWERNIGMDSPFQLERGLNALWMDGGVHFPVAFD